ncbi:MAG: hypothetical protein LLG01_05730 [Planctomycetaceae bacterium]|nr:hypothetical protein [Planctomycetaceae bacterium]
MQVERDSKFSWSKGLRLALALGIVWGAAMFLTGVVAGYTTAYAHEMVKAFASIYFGFGPGWGGALLGLLWGFADVFLGTIVTVAIYNALGGRGRTAS